MRYCMLKGNIYAVGRRIYDVSRCSEGEGPCLKRLAILGNKLAIILFYQLFESITGSDRDVPLESWNTLAQPSPTWVTCHKRCLLRFGLRRLQGPMRHVWKRTFTLCEFATSQSRGFLKMIQHSRVTRVRGEWKEYLASCSPSLREVLRSDNNQRIAESRRTR